MGRERFKRPVTIPETTGVDALRGGIARFGGITFNPAEFASASSAATVIAWGGTVTLLSAVSSAGAAGPVVMSMAAATSGDTALLFVSNVSASGTSQGVSVRLQASSTALTFDGTNDQLHFSSSDLRSALLVKLSSGRVGVIVPTTGMLGASSS